MNLIPNELQALSQNKGVIPHLPQRMRTAFDISGTGSREVVFSQWYSYFLNPEEEHGLGCLFLQTLLRLAAPRFSFKQFKVKTEVVTRKGRIDILLTGVGQDTGKYIIIENKIHHTLENPLSDYWDFCRTESEHKVGILLTLKPENSNHPGFQNVLHHQWVSAVFNAAEQYPLTEVHRHRLIDFYQAIKNLTRYQTMSKHAEYFFNNAQAINQAIACREEAERYIDTQLENAGRLLGMKVVEEGWDRQRNYIPKGWEGHAYYAVVFNKLLSGEGELRIVLGLSKGHRTQERIHQLIQEFEKQAVEAGFAVNDNPGPTWFNLLTRRYLLSVEDWADLEGFVVRCISNDFYSFAKEVFIFLKGLQTQATNSEQHEQKIS